MQWLKWSSLRGTGALSWRRGAGGDTGHQNRINAMLGGPSEEVAFTDQQLCQTRLLECQLLALPDTTIDMQLCSFGQIRRKQSAMMKYWPDKYKPCEYINLE